MSVAASETPKPRVVLVDLSSLFWTAWHATKDQAVSEAAGIVRSNLRRCWREGDLVAVCCDQGRSWRKDLMPEYKANRPEKDDASLGELDRLKEILVKDGYLLWGVKGFEADDVIATACETAVMLGHEVQICSADKDLLQLLRPGVRALRTHNWTEDSQETVEQRFGIRCSQIGDWLALVGDNSDNIKGAPGIGAKTATELLSKFGNLDALYVQISTDPKAVGSRKNGTEVAKFVADIDLAEDGVRLARKLVDLNKNVPFDFREIYQRREVRPLVAVDDVTPEEEQEGTDVEFSDDRISAPPAPAPSAPEAPPVAATPAVKEEPTPAPQAAPAPTQLTVIPAVPVEFERALEPRNPDGAVTLAKHLFNSRIYGKFPTWESVLATIIRGRAMGITSAAALDVFHIVEGRPYPFAYLLIAMAKRSPDCEYLYCVESSPSSATWETKNKRNPKPSRFTYSLEQARAAGLVKPKSGWEKFPEQMLVKFTGVTLARREYQEEILGLTSFEEIEGGE